MAGRDMIVMSVSEVNRLKLMQSAIDRPITRQSYFCFNRTFQNWQDSRQDFLDMQDRTSYTSPRKKGVLIKTKLQGLPDS
jgi:hypothetical protein